MNKLDAILSVRRNYGNHPCGDKFCSCGWILTPPSYPGDFWDCTNPACGKTKTPSKADITKMRNPKSE